MDFLNNPLILSTLIHLISYETFEFLLLRYVIQYNYSHYQGFFIFEVYMFLHWGLSVKVLGAKKIDIKCNTCGSPGLSLTCMQRVFNIYWIPTIPLKKTT